MKTINLIILAFALIWGCTSRSSNISSSHNVPDSLDPTLEVENIGKDLSQEGGVSKNNTIIIEDHRNRRTTNEVIKSTKLIDELSDSLVSMAKTAEKFIKWYISDSSPIDQDKLITYSDPLGYYIFDTNYGEYYLNEFQNTEIVSDSLIQWLKNVFEQSKADYEYEKISLDTDGVIGFVADIIFNSQDLPAPFQVQGMKLEEFIYWKDNVITVGFDIISATLIYENGEWKIIRGGY